MSGEIKNKIERLRQSLRRHDYLYYVLGQPRISDKEYDDLMRHLKELEDKYPQYKSGSSPTVRISGGILEGFKTAKHRQKMYSLDNTYSFEELKDWAGRVLKGLGTEEKVEYVAELKIDGVSANITYSKGILVTGATRGDGETGEDVSENIKTIGAIPLVLMGEGIPEIIEIRGEVYMDRKDFVALNKERDLKAELLFANPRNAASGSLKLLDRSVAAKRKLNFFAHSLGEHKGEPVSTHREYLERLKGWGIRVNPHSKVCRDIDEVIDYCRLWQERKVGLSYQIDGAVVKVNSLVQQKRLGFTLKSPRWAIAYKFPAKQATTQVLKINLQVGRTGVITPVAELKPVECAGVVIKHATLHNFDQIKRLNVKEKDLVLIERSGEVIPKVVKVVKAQGEQPFKIPALCPVCSGRVVKEKEEEVAYRCINSSCPAQLLRGIMHFACRAAMDIEGMGIAVVEQLVSKKMVRDFADIYFLKKEDLLKLELFRQKKADNLLEAIAKSRKRPLSRLLFGLGIRHVGEKAAYVLAQKFLSLDKIMQAKKEEFEAIYEVGSVMAKAIEDFFKQPATKKLIARLKEGGLNFQQKTAKARQTALSGKTVVFTGELERLSRLEAEALARENGAEVSFSVGKKTDLVVAAANPGSKYEKAKKAGIKIIDEKEFFRLIEPI